MNRKENLEILIKNGIFAVVRVANNEILKNVIEAIYNGGIKNIEITMTVPNAERMISELVKTAPKDMIIGAGTVTDIESAKKVIDSGAKFVISPIFNPEVISFSISCDIVTIPGCFSPTEIFNSWNMGCDIVKVFPATALGPKYFKDIKAPFPFIRLMPTGGVSLNNIGEWISAGACAVALGTDLIKKEYVEASRFDLITENAKIATENLLAARKKLNNNE